MCALEMNAQLRMSHSDNDDDAIALAKNYEVAARLLADTFKTHRTGRRQPDAYYLEKACQFMEAAAASGDNSLSAAALEMKRLDELALKKPPRNSRAM